MKKNPEFLYAITFFLLVSLFAATSLYISTNVMIRINGDLMHSYYALPWK